MLNKAFDALKSGMSSLGPGSNSITFQSRGNLTLGVELELQLLDPATFLLSPRVDDAMRHLKTKTTYHPELYPDMIEVVSAIAGTVQDLEGDFTHSLDRLQNACADLGLGISGTGCHPLSRYNDCDIYPSPRYNDLIDRNQWLTRRWKVYGLHVHLGMKSGDSCIRYNNFLLHFVPHLLALSASSPFWQGEPTGLAACRPTTYEALPTAGLPYHLENWRAYQDLCGTLMRSGAIHSLKDLWWDLRPSPRLGTLEIRVCDEPASLGEVLAIVAYIHLLAHWFEDHGDWLDTVPTPPRWMMRENKWRVIRHGLEADLIVNLEGDTQPIRQNIEEWLNKLASYTSRLGYERYTAILRRILKEGNSSTRQRLVYEQTRSLQEVVRFNMEEWRDRQPHWHQFGGDEASKSAA